MANNTGRPASPPQHGMEQPQQQAPKRMENMPGRNKSGKRVLIISLIALVLIAVGGYLAYSRNQINKLKQENSRLQNPQEASKAEAEELKKEVSKLIELPTDESPTIATVVDASKLKEQAFFANAENGDRVLLFPKAKKAVLYRPSTKKIIEVAPINLGDGSDSTNPTPSQ